MMDRYDGTKSKDSAMANSRQARLESEHNSNDQFALRHNEEMGRMGGKAPNLKSEALQFSSYMCNNGEHAQELARSITAGLDKAAFPVK